MTNTNPAALPLPFNLPREARLVEPTTPEGTDLRLWLFEADYRGVKRPALVWATTRQKKCSPFYVYSTPAAREDRVQNLVKAVRSTAERKAADARARAEYVHDYKVGDLLVSSWGYDQTNVDFYEVVALKGAKNVVLRTVAHDSKETGFMSGTCTPRKGVFTGEAFTARVSVGGRATVRRGGSAGRWDGRECYWSSYA